MTMKIDPAIKHMPLLQVQLFFWNDQKSQKPLGSYYKHWAISVHLGAGSTMRVQNAKLLAPLGSSSKPLT
jgi:hypothetical protein